MTLSKQNQQLFWNAIINVALSKEATRYSNNARPFQYLPHNTRVVVKRCGTYPNSLTPDHVLIGSPSLGFTLPAPADKGVNAHFKLTLEEGLKTSGITDYTLVSTHEYDPKTTEIKDATEHVLILSEEAHKKLAVLALGAMIDPEIGASIMQTSERAYKAAFANPNSLEYERLRALIFQANISDEILSAYKMDAITQEFFELAGALGSIQRERGGEAGSRSRVSSLGSSDDVAFGQGL